MDDIRIERSQRKLWLMFLAAIGFVALGIWLLWLSSAPLVEHQRLNQPWLLVIIAWSAILFLGSCVIAIAKKLRDRSPGLVISAKGIQDTPSAISFGLIRWSEISEIRECQMAGQRFVVVMKSSYDKLFSDAGPFKRKLHAANIRLCGSPVSLCANPLTIDHASLLQLLQAQFAKYQAAKN